MAHTHEKPCFLSFSLSFWPPYSKQTALSCNCIDSTSAWNLTWNYDLPLVFTFGIFIFFNFKLLPIQYLQKMWIVTSCLSFFLTPYFYCQRGSSLSKVLQSKYFPSNSIKANPWWLIFRNFITLNRYLLNLYRNRESELCSGDIKTGKHIL